ncbi:Tubulin-specific chaperone A [Chionoecetes opilio]|uniref:Tubulin-specific chaperone A n=1 Tax=Chionoecetes opilio TaxID=41210 RepID=A0A8J4Y158_CHIOP|nr:Tubulin-specific chaperone A [Chionoecetes opilio]
MSENLVKQLRIKTGVLKRCCKELIMYQKEGVQLQEKIKKMQDEGQDVYYIKKQDQLLQETNTVIPDCQKRFNKAHHDLKTLVEEEKSVEESEEYKAAVAGLKDTATSLTA